MSRPTHAQVSIVEALADVMIAAAEAGALALSFADRRTCREITTAAEALVPLVDSSEEWVDPARAFALTADVEIRDVLQRTGER